MGKKRKIWREEKFWERREKFGEMRKFWGLDFEKEEKILGIGF